MYRFLLLISVFLMACDVEVPSTPAPGPIEVTVWAHAYVAPESVVVAGVEEPNPDAGRLVMVGELATAESGVTSAQLLLWAVPIPTGMPSWTGTTDDVPPTDAGVRYPFEGVLNTAKAIDWGTACGWHPDLGEPYIVDGCVFYAAEVIQ